jgi:hypothetical protein
MQTRRGFPLKFGCEPARIAGQVRTDTYLYG